MTRVRRLSGVIALLGFAALVSSSSQGQSGKKATPASPLTPQIANQVAPAKEVAQLSEASESRFNIPGAISYKPVQGDLYVAMQIQPKLDPAPRRPRDYLIMLSTSAAQGGAGFIAGHQIAEGIIKDEKTSQGTDRISLWTSNEPKFTKNLTKDFLLVKDYGENKRLTEALEKYRNSEYPSGNSDLKSALTDAIKTFDTTKDRQRILLFLGDGLSTYNPISEGDRLELAKMMTDRQIAFFTVPLGLQFNPNTLHGLANSTGGAVLRTQIEAEKLVDCLKRYEDAFATPILYSPNLQLPADVTEICPSTLPPLRSDTPTLVVGRMKKEGKQINYEVTGTIAGRNGRATIKVTEKVHAPSLDNYFLVSMIDQWTKAKAYPAVLRADRALGNAYEQTRLQHVEHLENAQLALQDNQLEAAASEFKRARTLSPHDGQAEAGLKIVERLKDGSLDKNKIRKELEKTRKADKLEVVNGKPQWVKVDFVKFEQEEVQPKQEPKVAPKQGGIGPEDLLKEHRERQAVEEQKVRQAVEDTIQQARRSLKADPDGTLDALRNLLNRVKDHPDLGLQTRDALSTRLQEALRTSATDVQRIKLTKQDQIAAAAVTTQNLIREQERKSFTERVEAQFNLYKNLMTLARFEEKTKNDILQAMVQIYDEARSKGYAVPLAAKATYDIALAALPLQTHNTLIRVREEKWLSVLMQVEKSHIPYPDEPGIYFPPLATWKALIKARKDKYEVTSLPDDEKGRESANAIKSMLDRTIETKGLQEKVKLKTALEYFSDKFDNKLPILIDREAFAIELGADAPDPYEEEVSLPPVPTKMAMQLALRLVLAQVGKGNATYLIRREFIEITTNKRYLEDKVIRIYPVGDLAMPIGNPMMGGMGMTPGMMMGGMGMMGMGGMMMGGGMGMMMGGMQFTGGSFQASFNGSLGAVGATQAMGLITLITNIVDPGNWNRPPQLQPFMQFGGFPGGVGMVGMIGMVGMMGMGMIGAGPPPDPNQNVDPQTSNSIDFFPPALALIVRAPSRVHTSITGGIVGGKSKRLELGAMNLIEREGLAKFQKEHPDVIVAPKALKERQEQLAKKREANDPTKVWNDALAKGGVTPGLVVATADFLFEAGEFKHAVEFLKANLRFGVVVRPWVFEALAVAMEMDGGNPEEIQRVRLSGIALDPKDAQGYLSAARAVADRGHFDRALAFCKQASHLDANDYHPYEMALSYAENSKDVKGMEWAVGKLVSQDWPVDNLFIQKTARQRLNSLAATLKSENRMGDAKSLEEALARLNQRDLRVRLVWDNASGPCELEMKVKEPTGSVCTLEQKQSPAGGIMIGWNLTDKEPSTEYVAAEAFTGEYEVTISRVYGQPLSNRARLEILVNAGTPKQVRKVEVVDLAKITTYKIKLNEGRRTEVATVSAGAQQKHERILTKEERSAFNELRNIANPNFFGATASIRGGAGAPGKMPTVASLASKDSSNKAPAAVPMMQNGINTQGGVPMTAQVRMNPDQRNYDLVIRPFFNSVNAAQNRGGMNLSVIPGGDR